MAKIYYAFSLLWFAFAGGSFLAGDKIWTVGGVICAVVTSAAGGVIAVINDKKRGALAERKKETDSE